MGAFLNAILATIIVSLISFIGLFFLSFKINLHKSLHYLVSFAVGALLAVAFLDLLPEAIEANKDVHTVFLLVLVGFIGSFVLEKFFYWHHHHFHLNGKKKEDDCTNHGEKCEVIKSYTYLNLIGDGLHNFMDGVIIAASFIA